MLPPSWINGTPSRAISDQLPAYMERAIRKNDFVMVVCTQGNSKLLTAPLLEWIRIDPYNYFYL